jgi:Mn-containing catalase
MTREITHMKAFALALDSLSKPAFSVGRIAPTPGLVNQFFNDFTGTGDHGEIDTRGPWNEGSDWVFVESPAIQKRRTRRSFRPYHREFTFRGSGRPRRTPDR